MLSEDGIAKWSRITVSLVLSCFYVIRWRCCPVVKDKELYYIVVLCHIDSPLCWSYSGKYTRSSWNVRCVRGIFLYYYLLFIYYNINVKIDKVYFGIEFIYLAIKKTCTVHMRIDKPWHSHSTKKERLLFPLRYFCCIRVLKFFKVFRLLTTNYCK
jgi:hypothetical protein